MPTKKCLEESRGGFQIYNARYNDGCIMLRVCFGSSFTATLHKVGGLTNN